MMDRTTQKQDMNDNLEEVTRKRDALNIKIRFVFMN